MKMKISTREVVLLTALFLLILAGAYYLLFYMPNSNEINELGESISNKTEQLEEATALLLQRQALSVKKEALEKEFGDVAKHLQEDFDDADILRRIENIIKPHTSIMNIEFANRNTGTSETAGLTSVRSVQVSLHTNYNDLQEIIKAFEVEDAANRIASFSVSGSYNAYSGSGGQIMRVNITVDYLSR